MRRPSLYRTFLLHEVPRLARYRHQRLAVPTRLVIGRDDMIGSPALLDGWQANADDMTVEVLDDVGHFIPDEAPATVAAASRRHLRMTTHLLSGD